MSSHPRRVPWLALAAVLTLPPVAGAQTLKRKLEWPRVAHTWHVDDDSPAGDGSSWTQALPTLVQALALAQPGDEIWVAAGTYTPSDTDTTVSFELESGIALYGGFAGFEVERDQRDWVANETVLSGDVGRDDQTTPTYLRVGSNSGHVVVGSSTDASAILDGFTVAYGAIGPPGTPSNSPLMAGSGMYNVGGSPTVRHCTFRRNQAAFVAGGGMYNWDSSPTVTHCRFEYNSVHVGSGGGMFDGGESQPVIEDCVFLGNACTAATPDASGGGLYHYAAPPLTLTRCRFEGNSVLPFYSVGDDLGYGGGVSVFLTPSVIVDCEFVSNRANYGGGLIAWDDALVVNCLFADNQAIEWPNDPYPDVGGWGGGFMSYSFAENTMRLVNCTVVENRAEKFAGVYGGWNSTSIVDNCIVWNNVSTHPEVVGYWHEDVGGTVQFHYSCVRRILGPPEAGEDVLQPEQLVGCIEDDPLFVDAPAANWRLSVASPCIDAADNAAVPRGVLTDLDGGDRFVDDPLVPDTGAGAAPVVDMGAYERVP